MKSSRVLSGAILVGSVAVASMFAAAPAAAATLPLGQQISVIVPPEQFAFANPTTAAVTPVGSANVLEGDVFQGVDVDDNGVGYAVSTYYPDGPDGAYLYKADAKTGSLEYISLGGPIRFFFGDFYETPDECQGIDYTGGTLYLACGIYGEGARSWIGVWDFDLQAAIPLVTLNGDPNIEYDPEGQFPNEPPNGFDFKQITSLAVNPVNGLIYITTSEYDIETGYLYGVYTVSQDHGAAFLADTNDYYVGGADFDRGGQLWVTVQRDRQIDRAVEPGEYGLATVDLATGELPFTAAWEEQDPGMFTRAITVWGVLAATGSTMSIAPAIAASGVLLLGAILAAGTMLRRRSADV